MSKEIVIQATKRETRIAIVEDGALAELYIETPNNARTIGDIYLGRVRNVMPSIQAAFVNIGQKQDAFLHFSDVGETLEDLLKMIGEEPALSDIDVHVPRVHRSLRSNGEEAVVDESAKKSRGQKKSSRRQKGGSGFVHPARYLRNGARILVQIVKEPISTKGSRVTSHVTLAGRFLVLVPYGDYVAVSKKIWSARERKRLQTLGKSLVPDGFGLIIRTVAAGKDSKTLHTDMSLLAQKWEKIQEKLENKAQPPKLLHQDVSMVSSVIRDLFTDDYDRVLIDDPRLFRSIQTYIRAVAPHLLPAIQQHEGDQPIFEKVKIDGAVAEAFLSRVELPSGGYVIIEHTEAMHVIDVNSGRAGKGESQEDNSLRVNLEAATVVARQLRLRDLGGIIVVDFIDLRDEKNRNKVGSRLKQAFRRDRAVTKVLPMSDFGLVEITRQRLRPSITTDQATREAEQAATNGTAETAAQEKKAPPPPREQQPRPEIPIDVLMKRIEKDVVKMKEQKEREHPTLAVHPFLAAFLRKGVPNQLGKWLMKHRVRVRLELDDGLYPTQYAWRRLTKENKKEKETAK
ncbi:MAG: Rne/Rng family ribonuclease [Rhodothermales bacterium]